MSRELLLAQAELEEVGTWLSEVDPIVWIIAGVVLLILIGLLVLALGRKRQRREELRSRFGAEYDRTVRQAKSRKRAEEDLQIRRDRAKGFNLRPLSVEEREDFKARWEDIQVTFVDAPDTALRQADTLLDEASRARGYPDAGIDQRFDDLSVDHPERVAAYREASRDLSTRKRSRPTNDQQREAFLKLRTLFEAVVEEGDAEHVAEPPPAYEHAGEETADRTATLEEQPKTTSTADAAPATSPAEPPPAAPHPADPSAEAAPEPGTEAPRSDTEARRPDTAAPQSGTGEPADERSYPPVTETRR